MKVARADAHPEWLGRTVVDLGAEWGVDPFDAFLDASLAEALRTTFTLGGSLGASSRRTTEEVVRHPASLPGSSDAGAHLTSYCGVDFSTRLLSEYVPDVVSLEEAVRRLATIPAQLYGFTDRGWLGAGAHADLVVWDPTDAGCRCHPVGRGLPRRRWPLRGRRHRATARSSSTAWSCAPTASTPARVRVGCSGPTAAAG